MYECVLYVNACTYVLVFILLCVYVCACVLHVAEFVFYSIVCCWVLIHMSKMVCVGGCMCGVCIHCIHMHAYIRMGVMLHYVYHENLYVVYKCAHVCVHGICVCTWHMCV